MRGKTVMFYYILYIFLLLSLLSHLPYTFEAVKPSYPVIIRTHPLDNNENDNNDVFPRILQVNLDRFGSISLLSHHYHRGNY